MGLTGEPWVWLLGAVAALLGLGWGLRRRAPHHAKPADVRKQLRIQQLRDIAEKRATAAREARDHAERAAMLDERVEQARRSEDRPGDSARLLDDVLGTPPSGQRRR